MNEEDKQFIKLVKTTTRNLMKYIKYFNKYSEKHLDSLKMLHIGLLFDDMESCLNRVEHKIKLLK